MIKYMFIFWLGFVTHLCGFHITKTISVSDPDLDEVNGSQLAFNDKGDIVLLWNAKVNNKSALQLSEKVNGCSWSKTQTLSSWGEEISNTGIHLDSKGVTSIWWKDTESKETTLHLIQKPLKEENLNYSMLPSSIFSEGVILTNGNFAQITSDLNYSNINVCGNITKSLHIREYSPSQRPSAINNFTKMQLVLDIPSFISNHKTHEFVVWTEQDLSLNCSWYKDGQWSLPEKLGNLPNTASVVNNTSGVIDQKGRGALAIPLFDQSSNEMNFFVTSFSEGVFSPVQEIGNNEFAVGPNCSINQFGDIFIVWTSAYDKLGHVGAAYKLHNQEEFTLVDTTNLDGDNLFPIVRCKPTGDFIILWENIEENDVASLCGIQFSIDKQNFLPPIKLYSGKGGDLHFQDFLVSGEDQGIITWIFENKIQISEFHL